MDNSIAPTGFNCVKKGALIHLHAKKHRRTVLYLGKSETLPAGFDAVAFSLRYGPFAALATSCTNVKSQAANTSEKPNIPLLQISRIGFEEWADVSVLSLLDDKDSVSLLLSSEIPKDRIKVLRKGALHDLLHLEAEVLAGQQDWLPLKDCHRGRRAFILGNGPSLRIGDLSMLKEEVTFASNRIYLAFDQTDWRPTYYTVCDELVAQSNTETIGALDGMALFPRTLQKYRCGFKKGLWYDERYENGFVGALDAQEREGARLFFSRDVRFGVHGGYTVIYHQLQLAYHMGIREVYLLGVDFHFVVPDTKVEDSHFNSAPYRNALVSQGEVNHFHKDYRKPGEKWSVPRLDLQGCAFRTARQVFESGGGHLVNASRQTALTVLPKSNFDDLFPASHAG